jgi:hypothetical protein
MRKSVARMTPSTRAVPVVEEMFRRRVINGDDGELQFSFVRHRSQSNHSGRRFLHACNDSVGVFLSSCMQFVNQIGAVVQRDRGLVIDRGVDVRVVRAAILCTNRKNRDFEILNQRGGYIVLCAQRIRCTENNMSAAGLQRSG